MQPKYRHATADDDKSARIYSTRVRVKRHVKTPRPRPQQRPAKNLRQQRRQVVPLAAHRRVRQRGQRCLQHRHHGQRRAGRRGRHCHTPRKVAQQEAQSVAFEGQQISGTSL